MKQWQQMVLAWLAFLSYLLAGAFIFQSIELPHERLAAQRFQREMDAFLAQHPCVSARELHYFSELVIEAVDRGVFSLHDEGLKAAGDGETDSVMDNISYEERRTIWDLPNSFFFSATIVTTIGYGDLTPQSSEGRIVCMVYGAIGLPLTAWVIGVLARSLTAYWTRALDRADKLLRFCVRYVRLRKAFMTLITVLVLYGVLLQVPATVLGHFEQWDLLSAVYYCFITLTTIGFGDLVVGNHPDFSQAAKWTLKCCMVVYVMLGLSLLVALSSAIVERANKTVRKTLGSRNRYEFSPQSQRRRDRERQKEALENEVALSHVPDLSSARLAPGDRDAPPGDEPKHTKASNNGSFIEMRLLGDRPPSPDVPPPYDDLEDGSDTSETAACCGRRTRSTRTEPAVHGPPPGGAGNHRDSSGAVAVISMDEFGFVGYDSVSTSSTT